MRPFGSPNYIRISKWMNKCSAPGMDKMCDHYICRDSVVHFKHLAALAMLEAVQEFEKDPAGAAELMRARAKFLKDEAAEEFKKMLATLGEVKS